MTGSNQAGRVPSPGWWWNLPILLLFGILISLGIRSKVTADNRYGWGTFGRQVVYQLAYGWEFANGKVYRYHPGNELRKKAQNLLDSNGQNNTRYGLGAILVWLDGYERYMWEHRPEGAVAFHTVMIYELDVSRRLRLTKDAKKLRFQYAGEDHE